MTLESYHSFSGYTGVFEDNGSFGVIYIQDPQGKTIRDGWVYNRQIDSADSEDTDSEGIGENTFRVPNQYVTENLLNTIPQAEIELSWEDEGETLCLLWKGDKVAEISFLTGRGRSKWLKQVCPWGLPFDEDI